MTDDRDKIYGIVLGLAAFVFSQQRSEAAEMKRLPPVRSEERTEPRERIQSTPKLPPRRNGVTQSVWWKEDSPAETGAKAKQADVQLVNWEDEPYVPPVDVEIDSNENNSATAGVAVTPAEESQKEKYSYTKFVSQQATEQHAVQAQSRFKEQTAPAATTQTATNLPASSQDSTQPATNQSPAADPSPAAGTSSSQAPSASSSKSSTNGSSPANGESIEPGTPFVEDDGTMFNTSCCDSACDSCCNACLPPCWYFQADALMLIRSAIPTIKIVEQGTGAPVRGQRDPLLTTDSLDPNPAWGPRLTLGHYLSDTHNLEFVYFGLHHWSSRTAFDGINGVGFSFNNIDVPFDSNYTSDFDGGQFVSADYASKLHNFEMNLVTNNRWDLNVSTGYPWYHYVDFLMGFRYLRLSEDFDLQSTDAGQTSDYLIDTVNDLVGGQIGFVVGNYNSPRISWNMTTKAGIFTNFGCQSTLLRDDGNTVLLRNFHTEAEQLAFVGDFSLNLAYDITPRVSVVGGYYLLYVGGVALAPEQLDFTTTPTSGSRLDQNGDAFYHGPSVGLRIIF